MYGDVNACVYEEEMLFEHEPTWREQASDAANRYVGRPARQAYRGAANHPMVTIMGALALAGIAAVAYGAWRQSQRRPERYGPLWNVPPRDMRGVTMPSQQQIHRYEQEYETEPSAAQSIP